MIRNVLKPFGLIRVALAVTVGIPFLITSNAFAQDPVPPPPPDQAAAGAATTAEVERVVVTGSNIPTAEEVGPNPVDTYRKDDIARLGVRTASDLIHKLPSASGSMINENNTNGGDGRAEINLRGILAKETLVLQDGRRLAPIGFAGSTVDLNTLPLHAVDHIDILKDGASAIYGSDAVAGVVNVWLIKKFRGLEVGAQYGNSNMGFANDGMEVNAWLLGGTGDDKTDIVVLAEYFQRNAIFSRDSDISHTANAIPFGGNDVRSGNFSGRTQGRIFDPRFAVPPGPQPGGPRSPVVGPFTVATHPQFRPLTRNDFFNFAQNTPSIAAADRQYFYGSFTRDICEKYLTVFADFRYSRSFWDGALAPAPFVPDVFTDADRPFGISAAGFSVPVQNPFNPFLAETDYVSPGGTSPLNPGGIFSQAPAGQAFITGVRYRALEAGLRTDKITAQNYLFTAGIKGELGQFGDYFKTWRWEGAFRYNEDYRVERVGGIINNFAFRQLLLDTNPATAFNPFGLGTNRPSVVRNVFVTTNEIGSTTMELEDFTINGDLFPLPAGPVSFAIGGSHRRETTTDDPDPLTDVGQTTGATTGDPTRGSRDVWSAFWEVRVPITSPTWNFPGLYSLELSYQERYDNFSDFGDTERPKFLARWNPFDSALTIRATYSEAFHAPTLGELFGGNAQSFPNVTDPVSTNTEPQVEQRFSGNPNLLPETAYEWTYGAVVSPGKWWSPLQGLTLAADFYHIDLRSVSLSLEAQFLINNEAIFPAQVIRDPGSNAIVLLLTPNQNLGRIIMEGWDFEVAYIFESARLGGPDWGTFTFTYNHSYIDRAVVQFVPGGAEEVVVGKFGGGFLGENGGGAFTHNRSYGSLFYNGADGTWLQGLDAGVTIHYVGQYWDSRTFTHFNPQPADPGAPPNGNNGRPRIFVGNDDRKIREWITTDVLLNYTFNLPPPVAQTEVAGYAKDGGKNVKMSGKDKSIPVSTAEYNPCGWRFWADQTTITLGMNNVFDLQPPFVAAAFENGYDQETSNNKGRFWFVGVKKRF